MDAVMQKIKVSVRMSESLRERLKVEAKHSVRSLNGEIIHRLLQSLKQTDQRDQGAAASA
jgi:predicted HicB family RNase H-like nuclease